MKNQNLKNIYVDNDFNLYVEFNDGEKRRVNLKTWIDGNSKIKNDIDFCKQAFIEHGCIISWPSGLSIDPEEIYEEGIKINTMPKFKKTGSFIDKINLLKTDIGGL